MYNIRRMAAPRYSKISNTGIMPQLPVPEGICDGLRNPILQIREQTGICRVLGPTNIAIISAIKMGVNYVFSISKTYEGELTPGGIHSAIVKLCDAGILESAGYVGHPGKGPMRHVFRLTRAGESLVSFLEAHDGYYRLCATWSKKS